jgi:hypothetical protein
VLVAGSFVAGIALGLNGIAYETSLQEHVPGDSLARVASIDNLGSLVPVPLGQLAVIPIAAAFGDAQVALAAGVLYAVAAAVVLGVRSIRQLPHETV